MQYCGYCGAELPEYARFCRNCGNFADDEVKNVIGVVNPSPLNLPSSDTPPLLDNSSYTPPHPVEGAPSSAQDVDETMHKNWSGKEEFNPQTWHYLDRQSDEYQTIGPEVIAPLAAGGLGQIPASNVPGVPGTPQLGGVPGVPGTPQLGGVPGVPGTPQLGNGPGMQGGVQGNPHLAGHAPAPHELAHQAPSPSAPAPQHAWTWEHHATPPHHQQHSMPAEQHHPAHKARGRHGHEQTHHAHRFHLGRAHHTGMTTASKAATGVAAKWAIILLAAVVVMASGGIIFVLASSPALSLSSSGTVSVGGILQLHGRGFVPGGSITLTVDNGLPATLAESRPIQGASSSSGVANLADMLNNTQAQNANGTIVVGITGTFDANVVAQSSWPAGRNILHAKESSGSRIADVVFTLLAQPAHLEINPTTLDFGAISQGSRVAESVLIGDAGGSPLNWNATTDGSPWLALQSSSGALQPNGAQDALYALVNTGKLKQGTYSAEISIHSNGGDAQIAVHMRVGPPLTTKQAQLNVNPAHLDFGQLTAGQQVTNTLTIGNQGTLALQWQGSINNGAGWLSLQPSSGSVQPGGIPQNVQVTVDTRNSSLQAGSNTASIIIHSNGGNVTIPVTLTLLPGNTPTPSPSPSPTSIPSPSPTPSPTPSPSPTPTLSPSPTPTPVIQVAPVNIDQTSSSCSQNSDGTYTCAVTVSESTPGNLNWFAPTGIGSAKITFSPASGQFSPGLTSQQVTIASIPCASNSFTFVDQNNTTATVKWSCTVQQPVGTASLGSCSYTAVSGWNCPVTITANASNQVAWSWNATSSGVSGMSINPASGSLSPGQSATATVTIPDMLCPASATITISSAASAIPLSWSCSAPSLGVTVNTPTCPGDSTNGWTCTVTLFLSSGSQGQLTWTSSVSSNLPGASLSPASGTISAGQQTVVNISIPANDCTNGSFFFSGSDGSNATVTWTCPQTG
jgi:Viral BACON domain/Flagellar-associated PapD-like